MKRWMTALAAVIAAAAATAGSALAADPVQATTQSSSTGQAAIAASSATQIAPSNSNTSVRVLSPGNDGSVSQSNSATSSANAGNLASTTQAASQTASGCGCMPHLTSGRIDDVLAGAMQAAAASPAPTAAQSNDASSAGTSANAAPTTQTSQQSGSGGGGVQSTTQGSDTTQIAGAASSAEQVAPSNSNISVRVLSPGDDGSVSQSNDATSHANAGNVASTTQGSSQSGSGSGVQSTTQDASTTQLAGALSSAKQDHPENSNISVRVLSPGNGGSVSQENNATSTASALNAAPTTQAATQTGAGGSCGCHDGGSGVQAIGQSSSTLQAALAASSATQIAPSNVSNPIRIASTGNDGSLTQSNDASSHAVAANLAPVVQGASQTQSGTSCGCSSGPAVQAIGQSSEIGQLAVGLSSATQVGATNDSQPVRIWSNGNGGSVSQSNTASSGAAALNAALPVQAATQTQSGSGVQALGQHSVVEQAAIAASSALQLPGHSECGCGSGFGNSAGPVRVWSSGDDGSLTQSNAAHSAALAANLAAPTQAGQQTQSGGCGCSGLGIQALGQESAVEQLAKALSSAAQVGATNQSSPARVWSTGGGGSVDQANDATSHALAPNVAKILQAGQQVMV
jgi:hypothetical protein